MTLSQIMRRSRWGDVSRYVKRFHRHTDKLTLSLYEKMFNEMQRIEPEGEGMCIELHRYNSNLDGLDWGENYRFKADIKVSPRGKLLRYMWSRYLGAKVKDMCETKRKYREAESCNETNENDAEPCAMPYAAITANMLCHLSGHGYSQAEVENNIKRNLTDEAMGYSVCRVLPFQEQIGIDVRQMLISKIPDKRLVDDFLNDNDSQRRYAEIVCLTTYFSTLYGWSRKIVSHASIALTDIVTRRPCNRSYMVIACLPSYELSEEAISTIKYHLDAPHLRKTLFVEDDSLTDRIRVEVFVGTYC